MKEKEIKIEPLKETKLNIQLIGDTDLILHGRSRYYLQSEIWKQSHPKGAEPPAIYKQNKNEWEALITSIHWLNHITYHDEDISLYSEEEWKDYMQNNKPCIQGIAFYKSFAESFVTFFKDSIKKNGTDVKRAINMDKSMYPINFSSVEPRNSIVPTGGRNSTSVLASYNVFQGWSCEIGVSCPNIVFPPETILSIIQSTGKYMGVGTQRLNGYGRYHIGEVKMVQEG